MPKWFFIVLFLIWALFIAEFLTQPAAKAGIRGYRTGVEFTTP